MQKDGTLKPRTHASLSAVQRLRPRDLEVLRWVYEQYAARLDHLEALIGRSRRTTEDAVLRLCDVGFVRKRCYLMGEPQWVISTRRGLGALHVGLYHPRSPSVGRIMHLAAINEVRLYIQQRSPETLWIPERQLRMGRPSVESRPDGIAVFEEREVAIEVELAAKVPQRTAAIVAERERSYDALVYFCAPAPHRQLAKLAASGRFPKLEVRELPRLKDC